jgi:hypothetical protein
MPLARYLFYVGGVLFALLFVLDSYLPKTPVADGANANSPIIRIHSELKWPERIVFDTNLPTVIPPRIAGDEGRAPSPPAARERDALAQMQPSSARQPQPSNSRRREPRLQHQAKTARRRTVPQPFLAGRQPQFGWFRNSMWWGG